MTSQPSHEERNRLRLQAWEQRNQESRQATEQNLENAPLFGHPYKTNKGDELSNRIQRMLGSFDDNITTEPFNVPSCSTFPLTNSLYSICDHSYKSPKGSCVNPPSRRDFNSSKCQNEDDSQASNQDSELIHSYSLQKPALHEKTFSADVGPFPFAQSSELHSPEAKDSQFATPDEPQYHGSSENASSSSGNNVRFSTKGTPPFNRTLSMSHSQSFNPLLPYKQTNAAMMQKPTAYVRPMDGPEVVTENPELKLSPKHCTRQQDVIFNKSTQGKAYALPQFLETLSSEIQCVEHILSEMTCSWPPLLSGIHSPQAPKAQSSVRVTENSPNKGNGSDQPLLHQGSSVNSQLISESGINDPPVSNSETKPGLAQMPIKDWQRDKLINFSQQNYRSKSQWFAPQSPKLSSLKDSLKQFSVGVSSPADDNSNLLSLNQKTVNPPSPQLSSTQENCGHQSSHKIHSTISLSESPLPTGPEKNSLKKQNESVSVHLERTTLHDKGPGLKERPKVNTEGRHQKQNGSAAFECEVTDHSKNNIKKAFRLTGLPCTACMNANSSQSTSSDHITLVCSCGNSKVETKLKKVPSLSQQDKLLNGCSQDDNKDKLSLVVKINLNLLSKIPLESFENRTKHDKPYQVTGSRTNDKRDQYCKKKKPKLQGNNSCLHTARLENSNAAETMHKRSKRKDEILPVSSSLRGCSQKSKKHKLYCGNAPQLNKEEVECPNNPRKNFGKIIEESTAKKPIKESSNNRPLLRFEHRHYSVKHYLKEAKRLKHKADAEMDKLRKVFHYLNGALFFIESGIAMERDPQISMSSYTMFAETVELIKFVLKLTNSEEPSPTENDILALCLKCQALVQLAMFRHKEKAAISYSKTLIDHFDNSSQSPQDPSSFVNSGPAPPRSAARASGAPSGSVVVPQDIGQVALTYVNITRLFLSAHDLWEQAEEAANKGSGLSTELNTAMGVLSLTSTMSTMVCYLRQGLYWLQMDHLR